MQIETVSVLTHLLFGNCHVDEKRFKRCIFKGIYGKVDWLNNDSGTYAEPEVVMSETKKMINYTVAV